MGCAEIEGGTACGCCYWGLGWSSLRSHEACEKCTNMVVEPHAGAAPGAVGGAPYGATNRVKRAPKWR
eukprot:8575312-Pyramimonas_sp.AAC.1